MDIHRKTYYGNQKSKYTIAHCNWSSFSLSSIRAALGCHAAVRVPWLVGIVWYILDTFLFSLGYQHKISDLSRIIPLSCIFKVEKSYSCSHYKCKSGSSLEITTKLSLFKCRLSFIDTSWGIKLPMYVTFPRNLWSCYKFIGAVISVIPCNFLVSGCMHLFDTCLLTCCTGGSQQTAPVVSQYYFNGNFNRL